MSNTEIAKIEKEAQALREQAEDADPPPAAMMLRQAAQKIEDAARLARLACMLDDD